MYIYTFLLISTICGVNARYPGMHFVYFTQDGRRELTTTNDLDQVDVSKPTTLVIHGYIADVALDIYLVNISETLAKRDDRNVIFVDWGHRSLGNYATIVVFDIPEIAQEVTDFVMQLYERGAALSSFHLIGSSLGAHISGYIGRYIQERVPDGKLGRITALDPAGPLYWRLFFYFDNPLSLGPGDAEIVDCLHTNGGLFGTNENIGTVDFYVNGGSTQGYCVNLNFTVPILEYVFVEVCNHIFSSIFYQVTIGSTDYKASTSRDTCENVTVIGDLFDGKAKGIYYIDTENVYPYKTRC